MGALRYKSTLITALGLSMGISSAQADTTEDYAWAEQLVHTYLYDGMLQVWQQDRRPWNRLLSAHACQSDNTDQILSDSYSANTVLFARSMMDFGEFENDGPLSETRQQAVHDLSRLAFRLFSSAYAHGYARQVRYADGVSQGLHQTLCGDKAPAELLSTVQYPDVDEWSDQTREQALHITLHAEKGVDTFMGSVARHYDTMDALVYSHAYQVMDSYQSLFFTVNSEHNIADYASTLAESLAPEAVGEQAYSEFAYLTLTSGYHWGTLSVLAMLESEFPEIHEKVNMMAQRHIRNVTDSSANTMEAAGS